MGRYELLPGGPHHHKEPGQDTERLYKSGEIIKTRLPLDTMFKGKFRKLDEITPPTAGEEPVKEEPKSDKDGTKPAKGTDGKEGRGEDVSADFDSDKVEGYDIFQRGDLFHVYETGKTKPIHDKGLKRGEVLKTIKKFEDE